MDPLLRAQLIARALQVTQALLMAVLLLFEFGAEGSALRIEAANRLGVEKRGYNLLWVVEMPFFEYDAESGEYVAMHHPFTAPLEECLPYLDTDKAAVRARA